MTERRRLVKLVRDHVGEFIAAANGDTGGVEYGPVPDADRHPLLSAKLIEEATEYLMRPSLGELADVLECVRGLARFHDVDVNVPLFGRRGETQTKPTPATLHDVEKLAADKCAERGGFDEGIGMYVRTTAPTTHEGEHAEAGRMPFGERMVRLAEEMGVGPERAEQAERGGFGGEADDDATHYRYSGLAIDVDGGVAGTDARWALTSKGDPVRVVPDDAGAIILEGAYVHDYGTHANLRARSDLVAGCLAETGEMPPTFRYAERQLGPTLREMRARALSPAWQTQLECFIDDFDLNVDVVEQTRPPSLEQLRLDALLPGASPETLHRYIEALEAEVGLES